MRASCKEGGEAYQMVWEADTAVVVAPNQFMIMVIAARGSRPTTPCSIVESPRGTRPCALDFVAYVCRNLVLRFISFRERLNQAP